MTRRMLRFIAAIFLMPVAISPCAGGPATSMLANAGATPQSATVNTSFVHPLAVTVNHIDFALISKPAPDAAVVTGGK